MFGWLNRISPASSSAHTDNSEHTPVGKILEIVRSDRNMLTVRLHGEETSYNSTLLEIDHHNKSFLIDELFPTEGNTILRKGNRVHVITRQSGIHIEFDSTVHKRGKQDRFTVYQMQFPEYIRQEQRRDSHRAPVDLSNNPRVTISTPSGVQLAGQLTDISTGGFGALFNSNAQLNKATVMEDCSIQIKVATRQGFAGNQYVSADCHVGRNVNGPGRMTQRLSHSVKY